MKKQTQTMNKDRRNRDRKSCVSPAQPAFTLIELMVVVMIVGILAAVAIPLMRGRTDAAKWTEAKAAVGTIATALRAYAAENRSDGTYPPSLSELGFTKSDLHGTYFDFSAYSIPFARYTDGAIPELTFVIVATNWNLKPQEMVLRVDANGDTVWGERTVIGPPLSPPPNLPTLPPVANGPP